MTPAASLQSHVLRLTNRSEDLDSLCDTLLSLFIISVAERLSLSETSCDSYVTLIWCFLSINSNNLRGVTSSVHVTYMWTLKLSLLAIWSDIIFQRDMMSEYQRYSSWAELSWVRLWRTKRIRKWREAQNSCDDLMMGFRKINSVKSQMKKTVTKRFY